MRAQGLVTDFGKFLDPLADKFMCISAMMCIMYRSHSEPLIFNICMILVMVTVFRELAVASIRLIAVRNANVVVAANMLGKIKTVSQIVAVSTVFLEPVLQYVLKVIIEAVTGDKLFWRTDIVPLSWLTILFSLVMTVWSGLNYILAYWKYLDPEK